MTETFTITRKRFTPTDPRLGRHVNHDSRSLNYPVESAPIGSLKSIRHKTYIPVLNQGDRASCVGNASLACAASGLFWPTIQNLAPLSTTDANVDEDFAVTIYSEATQLDGFPGSFPPTDTGSDGLSGAKALKARGLISGYAHATDLAGVLTSLSRQPVIMGTEWTDNMFHPQPDGRLVVSGSVAGGHEWVLDELDVHNRRVWLLNSWTSQWGIQGRAYMSWDDLENLLHAQGDCTVFVPNTQPPPTPTPPVPPAPPAPPTPPQPVPPNPDVDFRQAAESFRDALNKFLGS